MRYQGVRLAGFGDTDALLGEVFAWQNRPLEPVYVIVYINALRVKIRDEGLGCVKGVEDGNLADTGPCPLNEGSYAELSQRRWNA